MKLFVWKNITSDTVVLTECIKTKTLFNKFEYLENKYSLAEKRKLIFMIFLDNTTVI